MEEEVEFLEGVESVIITENEDGTIDITINFNEEDPEEEYFFLTFFFFNLFFQRVDM